jgi:hypothetical protein
LQGQQVLLQPEIPVNGIKIIFLVGENGVQVIGKNSGNLVKALQVANAVQNGF